MLEMTDIEKMLNLTLDGLSDQIYTLRHIKSSPDRSLIVVACCRQVREFRKLLDEMEEKCLASICLYGEDTVSLSYNLAKANHDLALAYPDSEILQEGSQTSHQQYCDWRDKVALEVIIKEQRVTKSFSVLRRQTNNLLSEAIML